MLTHEELWPQQVVERSQAHPQHSPMAFGFHTASSVGTMVNEGVAPDG